MGLGQSRKVHVRAIMIAISTLLASGLSVAPPIQTVRAQAPPTGSDSATLSNQAKRLASRADTLARGSSSDQGAAVDLLRRAAELYSKGGSRRDAAATLSRLGLLFGRAGQPDSALTYLRQALPIARAVGNRGLEARTLNGIGAVFGGMGQQDSALAYLRQTLPIARASNDRAAEGEAFNEIAAISLHIGRPDSALAYYRQALSIRRAAGDRSGEGTTLNNIAVVFRSVGQPDSALAYNRQALPIARALGDRALEAGTLNNIGIVLTDIGQQDSGLVYYRRALPIRRATGDARGEAATLHNIGVVFIETGQPDSALAYYRQALPIRRAVGDRLGEATTLNNIGVVFRNYGEADSALAYYRETLLIRHAIRDRAGEAGTLHNLGRVFESVGQTDSALAYYRRALPIRRAVGARPGEALTLNNIGAVFSMIGKPDSALAYDRQALEIRRVIGDRAGEAESLHNIGAAFADIGMRDSALAYYRQALPIVRAVDARALEAYTLNNIGTILSAIGQRDSSLAYYRQALPISHSAGDRASEATTLRDLGKFFRAIGRFDSAVVYFDRSTALSARISKRAGGDFNRVSYNETTTDAYNLWTLTWLALAPRDGAAKGTAPVADRGSAAYGALAASERGRARALLDLMRDTTTQLEPGADFPVEGARLAATLRKSNSAGLVYLNTADTLVIWLISANGEVNVFRHAITRDTLAALVGELRAGLGAEDGGARLGLRGAALEGAELGARKPAGGGWRRRADELATILLPPAVLQRLKAEKEVVIVPQSALALVPFAALPAGASGEPFGAKLAIRYAPSLATLAEVEGRPGLSTGAARSASLHRALVVGNPKMPEVTVSSGGRDRLVPLPGAETESRGIAAQLGTQALTGAAATEAEVVRRLPKATVVHLATHGFAYSTEAKARSSFVALSPDSLHDGLLTVAKILDNPELKLTADLVVLSACQTGLGNLRQAEGTVGLQRAFLARGARSVLVSLWNVSDASTQKLMTGFYQHWLRDPDHPSKAEALRRAQEEVRKTPGFEHPRFWAAFQLAGAR